MNSVPKHLYTIMCEDVRREAFNKTTLVGVYGSQIYFKSMPGNLRQLCFFNRVAEALGSFRIRFRLTGPDGTDLAAGEGIAESPPDAGPEAEGTLVICLGNLTFKEEGRYLFEISAEDADSPWISYGYHVEERPEVFSE